MRMMKRNEICSTVDEVLSMIQFMTPITADDMQELYGVLRSRLPNYVLDISHRYREVSVKVWDAGGMLMTMRTIPVETA